MKSTLSWLLYATAVSAASHNQHTHPTRAAAIDASTIQGKWLFGYQGWFRKPGAGVNNHWSADGNTPGPNNIEIDFIPDVSQYPANCLFNTQLTLPNGQPAQLYDSSCAGVVDLHFKWMQQYGLDGVIVQRFLGSVGDQSFTTVLNQVQAAAEKYGLGFIVEYDVSGADSSQGSVATAVLNDYNANIKKYTTSSAYIHQNGKPVTMVFGIGFSGFKVTAADSINIASQLQSAGLYVGFGVPEQWSGDVTGNTGFVQAYKQADFISPWTVGGYSDAGYAGFHTSTQVPDAQLLKSLGKQYAPVIFPGTSALHLNGGNNPSAFDYFPRYNGSFYSAQADALTTMANKPLFIFSAMFDEVNEGTQIMPSLKTNQLPTNQKFVGYDNNFDDTSFYLELAGKKAAAFHAA
ncbi:hypothetical protein TRIATDRAFT_132630 [Trichoderma atroviride IMI 206040]|uniref:Glycoside hydrolase family 18 protein n=1 Tax=Hypocrea atroviridis (strain ATCC 20476 / IMI 206040) TaxID=452589 RepID=G9NRU3_HYPAI|nr:uncharacterized protein TRIATDRAFT_132630 [Trichoderma atroviride IMI 206040]EHK46725.1 hypothetical protein TRIATDRAFT_132630 [Trichoderma atroviride IMI 206040]